MEPTHPPPRDTRRALTVRVKADALTAIDRCATRDLRNRADEIRLMLAYATKNMPEGWTGK